MKKGIALSSYTAENTEAYGPGHLPKVRQLLRDRGKTQSSAALYITV